MATQTIGKLTAYWAERVTNIYLIRSFTNEKQEEKNGLEAAQGLYKANVRSAKVTFAGNMTANLMELLQRGVPIVFGMICCKTNTSICSSGSPSSRLPVR